MLREIRTAFAQLLQADAYFAGIPVITEDLKDIESELDQAISKLGLCVVILTIGASNSEDSTNSAQFDGIAPVAMVYEVPTLNETGKKADAVAERIAYLVKSIAASGGALVNAWTNFDLADGDCLRLVPDDQYVIYAVGCKACGSIEDEVRQAATPVITETDGNIELTCETLAAAIYYTLDGSEPIPSNPDAITTGNRAFFAPAEGLQLRVQAWAAGWLASEEATLESTAGGGDGIDPSMTVTFDQIRQALITKGGTFQLAADGTPVIKNGDTSKFHQIYVHEDGQQTPSVVAGNREDTQP